MSGGIVIARGRRVRGDEGVALVEAVFVFPVVLLVVFAIFEYGLLFAAQSTTQSSTRDGARFGSANFAVSGSNQAAADGIAAAVTTDLSARTDLDTPLKLLIYKAESDGTPSGGFSSCSQDCYRYTWSGSAWTFDNSSNIWTGPDACLDQQSGLNALDSIGVYVELRHNYITNAFGSNAVIKEHTVTRLEPLPLTQC